MSQNHQLFLLSDSAMQAASYSTYENFREKSSIGLGELKAWKQRVIDFQSQLEIVERQASLFDVDLSPLSSEAIAHSIEPFSLRQQNTEFWRWRFEDVGTAAMYFVIDYASGSAETGSAKTGDVKRQGQPLLLYIGETIKSNQRWKGEHDCKRYLLNYRQSHYDNGLRSKLGIAFWPEAPADRKARQKVESELIKRWRSPFNKENWQFWNTPFVDGKVSG